MNNGNMNDMSAGSSATSAAQKAAFDDVYTADGFLKSIMFVSLVLLQILFKE